MRVGVVQLSACSVIPNTTAHYEDYIATAVASGCHAVFFPELSDSGYDLDIASAQTAESPRFLAKQSQESGLWIFAGMRKPGRTRDANALYSFSPRGDLIVPYEKLHIFSNSDAREDLHFLPGRDPCLIDVDGVLFGLSICFDLRFPALYRSYAKAGAEVLVVVSAWPWKRIDDWQLLLRARALENQAYVVGVNYCGSRGNLSFGGKSMVCGPDGGIRAEADEQNPAFLLVDVDVHQVRQLRRNFPVLQYDLDIEACIHG